MTVRRKAGDLTRARAGEDPSPSRGAGVPGERPLPFFRNDVIILAGGLGKRIRESLGGLPKPMVPVAGRPFLEWALLYLRSFGFRSFVFSTGYRRELIRGFFGAGRRWGVRIRYVEEAEPLGTAGALRAAVAGTHTADVLVLNGDSLCLCDPGGFHRFHRARGGGATLCCVRVRDASRYGTVAFDARRRIERFIEKGKRGGGWVNAGMYWVRRGFLEGMEGRAPLSLERDILPRRTGGGLYAYCAKGAFIDIGTPEALARAPGFARRNALGRFARDIRGDA